MPEILGKPKSLYDVFERKVGKLKLTTHYCPGCGHGRIHKLIAEAMDRLDISDRSILISPVGCAVFAYYYFNCGNIQAAHGRAPAIATGVSRSNPDSLLVSYQGDGDLAAIGGNEIVHAANRGENLTVIFVNNGIYGMTGGQMAPTTLEGGKTTTTPYGRSPDNEGFPIRMAEMLSTLKAPVYVERTAVTNSKHIQKTKRAIYKALKAQKDGLGFSMVEILSPCPTAWRMTPVDSVKWVTDNMMKYFPVQNFKDETETRVPRKRKHPELSNEELYKVLKLTPGKADEEHEADFVQNFKEQRLRIAGFGGQGVMVAGTTLAMMAMDKGLDVSWIPSYGPEMRGGTANCHVILSGKKIGSPLVTNPNVLIAMNGPSLDTFEDKVVEGSLVMVNSSIVDRKVQRNDVTDLYIPFTDLASSVGLTAAANMVALGAYLTYTKVLPVEKLVSTVKKHLKKKDLVDQNLEAIKKGVEYVKQNYS